MPKLPYPQVPPQPIDDVIYRNLFTYAHLIDISYCIDRFHKIEEPFQCELGCSERFPNMTLVQQWYFDNSVCGYIASTRSDIFHYTEDKRAKKTVVVAIRGTRSLQDTITDARVEMVPYEGTHSRLRPCGDRCKIHRGFADYYQATMNAIDAYLRQEINDIGEDDYELVLVGHSMGGSVAVLLALYCLELGFDRLTLVTMGQPRLGNSAFTAWADEVLGSRNTLQHNDFSRKFVRVIHKDDIVTQVPTRGTGFFERYHQFENQIYINSTADAIPNSPEQVVDCFGNDHPLCIKNDFDMIRKTDYYSAHNTYFRHMGLCGLHI